MESKLCNEYYPADGFKLNHNEGLKSFAEQNGLCCIMLYNVLHTVSSPRFPNTMYCID